MMREIEKLFEALKDEFNQKMANVGYFTNLNDSIESHVAYAGGGSITDSYEDISMDEEEIQENDSSFADSNLKSNKLGSIDSEPESISNIEDSIRYNNFLENQIRRESENIVEDHKIDLTADHTTDIVNDILNQEDHDNVLNQVIDDTDENNEITVPNEPLQLNVVVENPPIEIRIEDEEVNEVLEDNQLPELNRNEDQVEEISEHIHESVPITTLHPKIAFITDSHQNDEVQNYEELSDIDTIPEIHDKEQIKEIIYKDSSNEINFKRTDKSLVSANAINVSEMIVYENISVMRDMKATEEIVIDDNEETNSMEINNVEIVENNAQIKPSEIRSPEPERIRKISSDRATTTRKPMRHYSSTRRMWSEMPEVIESGILASFPKKELQLQEAMFEIITSEESYVKSLMVLTSHFFQSELFTISDDKESFVTQIDKHHIFSNVIYILKASKNFMNDLEQRWHDEKPILYDICDVVLRHAVSDDFQHYVTYLRNQQYQTQALKRLSENESFKQQLSKLESSPKCGKLALDSFLMLPMQRLTRLKLLVEAVSKLQNCEELTDTIKPATKMMARNALEELKKLLNTSNTEKGLMDQKGALLSLINRIDFPRHIKRITFSDRILLREEEFRIHHQTPIKVIRKFSKKKQPLLTLLVFNDLLIITKKKNARLQVIDYCSKDSVEANSILCTHDNSSNDASSNTSAIDINNEPPSPFRSVGPTLLRSKTSITADEKKRLSVPLNNSFISMPSINKVDEHETKTQTFSLRLSNGRSDVFTSPIYLTARNKEERDLWLAIFNKDHFQSNPSLSSKPNAARLQKSLSLKINTNFTEKPPTRKRDSLKKTNE